MPCSRRGPLACAGFVCFVLLGPAEGQSRAEALTVTLEYEAAQVCPDAASFKTGVVARLGYDPFRDSAHDHVLVRITGGDGALEGRIEWRDRAGNWAGDQTFPRVTTDCVRLARTIAFALVVQIQLLASASAAAAAGPVAHAETPTPADPSPPVAPPQPAVVAEPPNGQQAVPAGTIAAGSARNGARPLFAVGAGTSVGFGLSSDPVALGRLFGRVAWPRVSLELAADVSLPATTRRADGAGFSQQLLLASAVACVTQARWNACFVGKGGQARMDGEDIDRPASAQVIVLQAGVRAGFLQPLGSRVFIGVHADGLVNLSRWTARLDQVPVWTAPRFAATLGLDAGIRFP
jgi:hypothetical protein